MEELLNQFGVTAWWAAVVLVAVPLVGVGLALRRQARRRVDRAGLARAARRPIREIVPGAVALVGRWRALDGTRGILEDEGGRVQVERAPFAPAIADGTELLVFGVATRQTDDPTAASYRGESRIWVVDAREKEHLVTAAVDALDRAVARARFRAAAGAVLVAAGVMVAITSSLIAYRANDSIEAADRS
jgi:hypothetical protein